MGVTEFTVSLDDFLKWATEYGVAGVSVSLTKDSPGFGQILIKAPGRTPGPLVSRLTLGEAPPDT